MSDNNNININTPDIGPYTRLQPFRFWCQKVLPLVYDESLSYYELLCKVVDYLNKTMEDVDQMITDMGEFQTADRDFKTDMVDRFIAFTRGVDQTLIRLEDYIDNYFNNLNVQTEINNKLDAMAEAGYFDTLFTTLFTDDIVTEAGTVTSAWIAENLLQETGYVIDNSLTVANAAADAKATGDSITKIKDSISVLEAPLVSGHYINTSGVETPSAAYSVTPYIEFTENDRFALIDFINSAFQSYCLGYAFYDINKTFISGSGNFDGTLTSESVTIPENCAFARFCTRTEVGYSPNAKVYITNVKSYLLKNEVEKTPGKNLFDKTAIITGYEVYADGNIQGYSDSCVTPYINVKNNYGLLFLAGMPNYAGDLPNRYYAFYAENKAVVKTGFIPLTTSSIILVIPDNAYYFAICPYQRASDPSSISLDSMTISLENQFYADYKEYVDGISNVPLNVEEKKTAGLSMLIFGDSISETATVSDDGTEYTENTRQNWPTYARSILKIGKLINFAKSGARYVDGSLEPRQNVSVQINSAISSGRTGDIIVLSLGTNDNASNLGTYAGAMSKATLNDLDKTVLYEAIRWAMWKIKITYPNAICFAATPIERGDREPIEAINNAIIEMAHRYNFIVIDAAVDSGIIKENQVWGADGVDTYDGLHPNTNGQLKMANLYSSVILRNISDNWHLPN